MKDRQEKEEYEKPNNKGLPPPSQFHRQSLPSVLKIP
jgi:hypothetical protein